MAGAGCPCPRVATPLWLQSRVPAEELAWEQLRRTCQLKHESWRAVRLCSGSLDLGLGKQDASPGLWCLPDPGNGECRGLLPGDAIRAHLLQESQACGGCLSCPTLPQGSLRACGLGPRVGEESTFVATSDKWKLQGS